jgi:hypothetical protein
VNQVGIKATGEDGERYISRKVPLLGKTAIVMVRLPPAKPMEVPKSIELTEEERNERTAASKLKTARELKEEGKTERAQSLCEEILAKYPKTEAAADARKLLNR